MKNLAKLAVPIGMVLLVLAALVIIAPLGAAAREGTTPSSGQPIGPENDPAPQEQLSTAQVLLPATDLALSGTGGRLPEIAANNEFAAAVFEIGSGIYIRAAQQGSGWGFTQLVASNADTPRLAFDQSANNVVHVVWDGGNGQYIRHTTCTLSDPIITCGTAINIASGTRTGRFRLPDVVVDSNNGVHVAWVDWDDPTLTNDNKIKTARSANGGASWTTVTAATLADSGSNIGGEPVLATAGSYVHLAYVEKGTYWSINYRRSSTGNHSWTNAKNYKSGVDVFNFNKISHPTIAASSSNVYMSWDSYSNSEDNYFGLLGALSSSSGGTWGTPEFITSMTATLKASRESGPPVEEVGLRPSLTARADHDFSIVWQQRPDIAGEDGNCTSEIYYAPDSSNWGGGDWGIVTADTKSNYAIDPDIAIDSNGIHVVFMKAADNGTCSGGDTNGYTVYYRGPFDSYSTKGTQIFMPIILK